jgi:arginase family enzyme
VRLATGTAEVGGWSTRELLSILDGLDGLEVVGADVGMYLLKPLDSLVGV